MRSEKDKGLVLESVSAGYGETTVVESISLSVRPGERVGIIGRNGAGKSTTMATAMGLTVMRAGSVTFNGVDVSALKANVRARLGLGYVPQTRDIFQSLTVEENLLSGSKRHGVKQLDAAYAMFPRLFERRANWGNELSGGEQQMLSIARALCGDPSVLLLDEPLEGLAPVVAQEVMRAIRELAAGAERSGLGCVLVEQQVDLVLDFCTRVIVLERGCCVFSGSPDALRADGEILERSVGLRKSPVAPRQVSLATS